VAGINQFAIQVFSGHVYAPEVVRRDPDQFFEFAGTVKNIQHFSMKVKFI